LPKLGGRKLFQMIQPGLISNYIKIGRDKFFDILRDRKLLVTQRRNRAKTTNSNHNFKKYPDLIKDYECNGIEQVLVSDITYIRVNETFCYLSLVTDLYSKKILGFHLSDSLKTEGCLYALRMALNQIDNKKHLIHHSDRGVQYCSEDYIKLLEFHNIKISMTQSGDPRDNAVAERVNGILKCEFLPEHTFKTKREAVKWALESVNKYNTLRPHLSCGMLTPEQAHKSGIVLKKMWKNYRLQKYLKHNT